jgi:hypothetical protein
MGLGYGVGNLGKIISPLGLALIFGGTNIIRPEASLNAMIRAMFFLAFWAALAAAAFVALGIETKGRSIEDIDAALAKPHLYLKDGCTACDFPIAHGAPRDDPRLQRPEAGEFRAAATDFQRRNRSPSSRPGTKEN